MKFNKKILFLVILFLFFLLVFNINNVLASDIEEEQNTFSCTSLIDNSTLTFTNELNSTVPDFINNFNNILENGRYCIFYKNSKYYMLAFEDTTIGMGGITYSDFSTGFLYFNENSKIRCVNFPATVYLYQNDEWLRQGNVLDFSIVPSGNPGLYSYSSDKLCYTAMNIYADENKNTVAYSAGINFFHPPQLQKMELEMLGEVIQAENPLVEVVELLPLIIVIVVSLVGLRLAWKQLKQLLKRA